MKLRKSVMVGTVVFVPARSPRVGGVRERGRAWQGCPHTHGWSPDAHGWSPERMEGAGQTRCGWRWVIGGQRALRKTQLEEVDPSLDQWRHQRVSVYSTTDDYRRSGTGQSEGKQARLSQPPLVTPGLDPPNREDAKPTLVKPRLARSQQEETKVWAEPTTVTHLGLEEPNRSQTRQPITVLIKATNNDQIKSLARANRKRPVRICSSPATNGRL